MKSHRLLIGLSALLLTLCGLVVASVVWDRLHTQYPTPDTESAFLQNYTPQRVIEEFESEKTSTYGQDRGRGWSQVRHMAGLNRLSSCVPQNGCPS